MWWQDDELLAAEKANLDRTIEFVDAVCVGNEIMQKGIADLDGLTREIDEARARFGRPVTTGFQPPGLAVPPRSRDLIGDFSFLNVHPWWVLHRNDPLTAAVWVVEAYECVVSWPGMPADRLVVVQETSFPSGALPPEVAPGATPENQKRFCEALLATDVPFVWFLSTDSPNIARSHRPVGTAGSGTRTGTRSRSSTSSVDGGAASLPFWNPRQRQVPGLLTKALPFVGLRITEHQAGRDDVCGRRLLWPGSSVPIAPHRSCGPVKLNLGGALSVLMMGRSAFGRGPAPLPTWFRWAQDRCEPTRVVDSTVEKRSRP